MQFEKWTDLDISKGRAAVMDLGPILFSGDNHALKLGVHVYNGTEPVTVTGSVAGSAIIANGQTITPFVTGKDGNAAWVEVPQAALVCQGRIEIFLRVSEDDEIAVSLYATGTVKRTTTGEAVNPGTVIPDIGTAVQECVDATAAATAAADDATAAASHAVRYDAAQTITDEQKTQARTNIGAASEAELQDAMDEHFPATGKLQAGVGTSAAANGAVATGVGTTASGRASHAEGQLTTADGQVAHAEGYGTAASGDYSHAEGLGTLASGDHQHAFGKYNVEDANDTYLELAGNGTGDNARSNARTLDWNGNEALAGDLTVNKGGAEEMEVGKELSSLKSAMLLEQDEIPDTVQSIVFDGSGNVQSITHKKRTDQSVTVRTDAFTFTGNVITEVRTLASGESLTIVTDTDTLITTATYAAA